MDGKRLFFHSPFTPDTVAEGEGPALVLQFLLQELMREEYLSGANPPLLAPFDWSWRTGVAVQGAGTWGITGVCVSRDGGGGKGIFEGFGAAMQGVGEDARAVHLVVSQK